MSVAPVLWIAQQIEATFLHHLKIVISPKLFASLINKWSFTLGFHYFTFFLLINIKKYVSQHSFRDYPHSSVAAIGLLRIQEFGKTKIKKQWKHSVRINLIYGICNKEYCIVYYFLHIVCYTCIILVKFIVNLWLYICVYVLFQGEGKLVVEHLPACQWCQGPEHRGPLWTNRRMSDIYSKCAWKSSEQRNNVASFWTY